MARGQTLATLLTMTKAELGYSLTTGVATAEDVRLRHLLAHNQKWLAAEYDWPFLKRTADVYFGAGDRTKPLPLTLDTERPKQVYSRYQNGWHPLVYGINADDFTIHDSDAEDTSDPILKWQYASDTTFEVWPLPASDTVVRFTGMKKLGALAADDDEAELDDLLIVLFTAASEAAAQQKANASALLSRAQRRLASLQSASPKPLQGFKLGGYQERSKPAWPTGGTLSGGTLANTASGTTPIPEGAASGTVSYNVGSAVPVAAVVTVQSPAGGLVLTATVDGPVTGTGFNYNLSGATDGPGYYIHWELTLQ